MPATDVFGWTMPTVGGSPGTWGQELNDLFDNDIEGDVSTIKTTADAALPVAGGTMTGELKILTETLTLVNSGNLTGAIAFDMDTAEYFYGTVTGNVTGITFNNLVASGSVEFFTLELLNGAAFTITWPAAIVWDGGIEPTLQAAGTDVIVFWTRDGGTTIRASQSYSAAT